MTREEVMALAAGPELDRTVAARLLPPRSDLVPFSASPLYAFVLAELLASRDIRLFLVDGCGERSGWATPGWVARFDLPDGHDTGEAIADTAALAICRAFFLVPERYLR